MIGHPRFRWAPKVPVALVVSWALASACGGRPVASPQRGLEVEKVTACGAAAKAGLQPGDRIVSWSQGGGEGTAIDTVFDLMEVELDRAPTGPVTLEVVRNGRQVAVVLATGKWALDATPVLPEAVRDRYAAGRDADHVAVRTAIWDEVVRSLRSAGESTVAAWLDYRSGLDLIAAGRIEAGLARVDAAKTAVLADGVTEAATIIRYGTAEALTDVGRLVEADEIYRSVLEGLGADQRMSLFAAACHYGIAAAAMRLGRIRDLEEAADQALAILERTGASGLEVSDALNLRGGAAYLRGDLAAAEADFRSAYDLFEESSQGGLDSSVPLSNLGLVAVKRGDLVAAEHYLRRALEATERCDSDGVRVGYAANYLGLLARDLGDHEQARAWYERALGVFRSISPDSFQVAGCLTNLASVARRQGDLATATRLYEEALEIRERRTPDSLELGAAKHNLGSMERLLGHRASSRALLEEALALKTRLAPPNLTLSNTLFELGRLDLEEGRLDDAASRLGDAHRIRHLLAPDTEEEAETTFVLGELAIRRGDEAEAVALWRRAIAMVERQVVPLDLTAEAGARFAARFSSYYLALEGLLCTRGEVAEAYELYEASRARSARLMTAQRNLVPAGVPERLRFERWQLRRELDRVRSRMGRDVASVQADGVVADRRRIAEIEAALRQTSTAIARAAPWAAGGLEPYPLDLAAIRGGLEPGTLVLSYAVGSDEVLLFSVTSARAAGPDLEVRPLEVGAEELDRRVSVVRGLIERGRTSPVVEDALVEQSARLYDLLIAPVEPAVAAAERVVIVADGALLALPFAALVRSRQPLEYLVEWKPVARASSASLLVELGRRTEPLGHHLAIVADPAGGPASTMPRLPASRLEARRIAETTDQATVVMGEAATEARVVGLARDADVLHLATHTVLDSRFPLESALVLSAGGGDARDDGLLRAWEVISRLRLEADLVVLSGCETGSGPEVAGEGLMGLAHAFQVAGPRSLVVSQWAVADRSTAELMARLYGGLASGAMIDDALRQAQLELLAGPVTTTDGQPLDGRHPFHWAAFELVGGR